MAENQQATWYIGTKEVLGVPMTEGEHRGVVTENREGYQVTYPDGYVSWSPKDVFEDAYKANGHLGFSEALYALMHGKRIARSGWNGRGMYLVYVSGGTSEHPLVEGGAEVEALPSIGMWTINAEGRRAFLIGWLASQSDMLSNDWLILED